ncbi:MAG: hypothetical protein J7L15_07475 [Clostridiales bacterium]|nr:hypothetical protein [Clostridiales bacterium]
MRNCKCDNCGKFISYEDLDIGEATITMILPDSHYSIETWETICKRCKKLEK